jgi:UDP-2-acetamido-3-amino-2,3-dideoxy-glucuronate N-acetyltransferase
VVIKSFGRDSFLSVGLTSQEKNGTFYFSFMYKETIKSVAVLSAIKTMDTKRVKYKSGTMSKEDFKILKEKVGSLLKITPPDGGESRRKFQGEVYHNLVPKSSFAHSSAFIDDNVQIGENTKIWHFSHILSGTTIGENCSFGQNCVVGPKVSVGNGVKVQNNVSIYEGVEIEDDVFLGPSMVFTNVINPRAFIQRKEEFKKTLLKKGCSIGANATIVCGVTIGEYALIGSGAVVNKDVPAFALMVGVPVRQIGWVGISGNTLDFINNKAEDEFAFYEIENDKLKVIKK